MSTSLLLRAAFAVLAMPGMVAGVIPWWIHRGTERWPLVIGDWSYLGALLILPGLLIFGSTVRDFFVRGRGTLAPWDPPRALVAEGLYRYCRNPMYVGVLLVIWGRRFWWRSGEVLGYGYLMALIFHLRVVWYEEPWLAETFGDQWTEYATGVRRWGAF